MYDFGNPVGESCYRLISRTGNFIYLKSRAILEVDDDTREVRSFICINTLVSGDEGRRLNQEMKKKFSAIISQEELDAMENGIVMDVENPRQLERAILNLITNLNNHPDDDDTASVISDCSRSTKAPLAIIPPSSTTVKQQVVQAYDVISHARGGKKGVEIKDEPLSPDTRATSSSTTAAGGPASEGQTKLSSQCVKVEPGADILSPNSTYSVSSHDSDLNSPPPVHHGSSYANRNARTSDFYLSYENLPNNSDPDTQASIRNSSSDSFSSNYSNYNSTTALETIADNSHRSSVLKRTHQHDNVIDNDDNEDYTALLKRRMLSDLTPVSQNPPLDLLAPSACTTATGSGTKTCIDLRINCVLIQSFLLH